MVRVRRAGARASIGKVVVWVAPDRGATGAYGALAGIVGWRDGRHRDAASWSSSSSSSSLIPTLCIVPFPYFALFVFFPSFALFPLMVVEGFSHYKFFFTPNPTPR